MGRARLSVQHPFDAEFRRTRAGGRQIKARFRRRVTGEMAFPACNARSLCFDTSFQLWRRRHHLLVRDTQNLRRVVFCPDLQPLQLPSFSGLHHDLVSTRQGVEWNADQGQPFAFVANHRLRQIVESYRGWCAKGDRQFEHRDAPGNRRVTGHGQCSFTDRERRKNESHVGKKPAKYSIQHAPIPERVKAQP